MAKKSNVKINNSGYYRITRTVGQRVNKAGNLVPIKKQFYGATKKEALQKYNLFLEEKSKGIENSKQCFGIMANNWINEFLTNNAKLKNSTKVLYIDTWNKYIVNSNIYGMPLNEITASVMQRLYNNLKCPPSVLATINKVMSKFYDYLVVEGFVTHNITASLTLKRIEHGANKDITVWSEEDLKTIMGSFDMAQEGFRLRFLIVLAYNTGCRISELLGLKYTDIVGNELRVSRQVAELNEYENGKKINKGLGITSLKSSSSERTIPLNKMVLQELKEHRKWQRIDMMKNGYRTEYLFTTNTGSLYYKRNIITACRRYYERIGVKPQKFHTYRHTFGTMLCNNGVPIQTASALLGHSDIKITAKYYVNVSQNEKEKAVDILAKIMQA